MSKFALPGVGAAIPFELHGELAVCNCTAPIVALHTARKAERLMPEARGLWAFYLGFYGGYAKIFTLSIVDRRDGLIMWRNGRHLFQEDESGNKVPVQRDHQCNCR